MLAARPGRATCVPPTVPDRSPATSQPAQCRSTCRPDRRCGTGCGHLADLGCVGGVRTTAAPRGCAPELTAARIGACAPAGALNSGVTVETWTVASSDRVRWSATCWWWWLSWPACGSAGGSGNAPTKRPAPRRTSGTRCSGPASASRSSTCGCGSCSWSGSGISTMHGRWTTGSPRSLPARRRTRRWATGRHRPTPRVPEATDPEDEPTAAPAQREQRSGDSVPGDAAVGRQGRRR